MQVFWCFVFVFLCCENVIVSQNLYEEYSTSITSGLGNNVSTTTISEPQETTITKNDDVHIDQKSVSVDDEPKLDNKPSIPGKEGTFETTSISYEKLNVTTNFEKVESTTSVLESNIYDTTTNTSKTVLSYDDSTNGSSETTTITTIEAITINFEKVETTTWFLESNIYDTTNTSQTEPSYDDPTNGSSETTTITTTISPTTTETSTTFEPTTTVEPCSSPDEINVTINNILENEISLNINAVLQESDCTFICLTKININCTVFPENSTIYPWTKLYGSATLELNDTNWYTVTIDNLSPFTNYKCVVQDFPSNDVSVQTLPAVTSPPSQLNVIVLSPQEVNISWQPPEFVSAVLKGYRVNITTWEVAQDGHLWNDCSSLDETSYTVNETVFIFTSWPDFIYNCTVEADSNAGYSEAISCSFSTPPDVPPPLEQVSVKVSEQEIGFKNIVMSPLVSWILPCDSKGPVQEIYLDIFGHYNLDVSRTIEYRNIIIPISNDIQEYVHSIPSVPAAYKFNFSILLSGTAGRGNVYEGLFETNDNYPSEPHINQTMKNSRNFTITWTEPANYPGKILDYTLDIIGKGANWPVTDHCDVSDASYSTSDHTLNREYINTRVLPDANYEIRLVAQTSRGDGNSTSSNITSEMSYPDYVSISIDINSYSNAETYNDTVTVKLVAGCFNGQFKSYDIRLVGTRDEHIIDKEDREVKEYDKTEHMFILQPEYFYVVVVTVSNEQYNRSNSLNFTAPSGVPKMDSSTLSNIKITPSQTETTLTLEKDYFDNSRGTVKYIAIIVSDQNITGGEFSKWEDNSMWPDPEASANVYYQATPMFWNPFANVDSIEFNLGANKSCEDEEQFCNKPLKPGTQYYVFVRVFNDNYYRNSMPIVFFTDEFTRVGLILGVIFGILALSLAGAFAFMLWRKGIIKISPREKQGYSGTLQESSEVLLSKSYEKWPIFRSFVQLDVQGPKTEIPIDKFLEYCTNLEHNSDVVKSQWEELVEQSKLLYNEYSTHFSTLPENKRKNRYTNILPFDHSRVKLNIDEDDEICSDYINASYIKGYSNQNEYIATQGPLSGTCKDFWKMILQENVKIIVMVSKFIENNKDKCYKYFPNNRETMLINGDDIEVRCSTELHFGYYCIRTLQVKKDLKQVSVTHMQFLEWPDFGVPDSTESMLHFCQQFKERWASEGGMAVVHCSAGVGRTGTLIATDILLRRLKDGKNIDVFNTILELRKQRMSMVQTDKQYVYIHQLIKSMLEFPMSDELNNQTEHVYENIEIKNNTDIVESSF